MQPQDHAQLVAALRSAADALVTRRSNIRDLESTLTEVVLTAIETVPGADAAGISLVENGRVSSRAPTDDLVRQLDDLQILLDEGPCMTTVANPSDRGEVHAPDLSVAPDSERWPNFAPRAVALGFRSLLSTQLSSDSIGLRAALNLYAHEANAFGTTSRTFAGLFGAQAALLLYGAEHASHLERALDTRDVIGRAKGILMERFDVDDDHAFQMLVRSSQDTNLKLVEVARWLTSPEGRHAPGHPATT